MENSNYMQKWETYFVQYRPYLMAFCFRMTGSLTEAEDILQDAFISCADVDPERITNHKSFLTKVCSNKSLDHLKVAWKKRETYKGVWLPDAVPESYQFWGNLEQSESPDHKLMLSESLSTSFLLLLQKLTPEERVVYLLSDIFEYSFKEIGEVLQKSEDACKKVAQRARKAFENQKRFLSRTPESEKLILNFFESAKNGDVDALTSMLSTDSEFWADSGGKVPAASLNVITDTIRTARFFAGIWSSKYFNTDAVKWEIKIVNERTGLVVSRKNEEGNWVFDTIFSFETENGKIARLFAQRNPDKLAALELTSIEN